MKLWAFCYERCLKYILVLKWVLALEVLWDFRIIGSWMGVGWHSEFWTSRFRALKVEFPNGTFRVHEKNKFWWLDNFAMKSHSNFGWFFKFWWLHHSPSSRGRKYLQKLQKLTSHLRTLEAIMTFEKISPQSFLVARGSSKCPCRHH